MPDAHSVKPRSRAHELHALGSEAGQPLASLRVQTNELALAEAGQFHAGWTPRGWSDAKSELIGFEQLLYLRQPGYVVGEAQLDKMIAHASHQAKATGKPFGLKETFAAIWASGILPPSIIDSEFLERLQ